MSTPAPACLCTDSSTAERLRAASAARSTGTPSSFAYIMRTRSSGRGKLPVCVVRKRPVLRCMGLLGAFLLTARARPLPLIFFLPLLERPLDSLLDILLRGNREELVGVRLVLRHRVLVRDARPLGDPDPFGPHREEIPHHPPEDVERDERDGGDGDDARPRPEGIAGGAGRAAPRAPPRGNPQNLQPPPRFPPAPGYPKPPPPPKNETDIPQGSRPP